MLMVLVRSFAVSFWKTTACFLQFDNRIFFGTFLGLLLTANSLSLADIIHFYNGKSTRGKVFNVTGDIIEFRPSFSRLQTFQRLTLANRYDIVEMRNFQKFFGEVIYADGFSI